MDKCQAAISHLHISHYFNRKKCHALTSLTMKYFVGEDYKLGLALHSVLCLCVLSACVYLIRHDSVLQQSVIS